MSRLRTMTAVALLALAVAACGNNKPVTPSSGGTTPAGGTSTPSITNKGTADATSITDKQEIEQDNEGTTEYYFSPTFVKVKPGQIITIDIKNEGTVQHTFTITSLGIDKTVDPGKETDVNITFPAAGGSDIEFFCRFHSNLGMKGAFFFGSTPTASASSTSGSSGYNSNY
jgi:plastocyanin